ncbi:MAG: site-2 protease family protein [Thermoplasmatales archaeon]|jgi:Predicted membrane-associated Zn-dependent proteases 1
MTTDNAPPEVKEIVSKYFTVSGERRIQPGFFEFDVFLPPNLESNFKSLYREIKEIGYIPFLSKNVKEGSSYLLTVIQRNYKKGLRIWINIILLIATLITTIYVGTVYLYAGYFGLTKVTPIDYLYGFVYFSLPLMVILGSHELGHYFTARRNNVAASLPFFIPAPPPFGTMGAFISLRDPIPDRKTLIKIGAAGPIVGFIMSIIIGIIGAYLGQVQKPVNVTNSQVEYEIMLPFIYSILPFLNAHYVHPVAFAAWIGFLVTAINLFPVGQLDGGHISRGLLGEKSKYLSYTFLMLLILLGLFNISWIFFAVIVIILGLNHPPPLNDISKPSYKELTIGAIAILLIAVSFSPQPITEKIFPNHMEAILSDGNSFLVNNSAQLDYINYSLNVRNLNNFSIPVEINVGKMRGNFTVKGYINDTLSPYQNKVYYILVNGSKANGGFYNLYINLTSSGASFTWKRSFYVTALDLNATAGNSNPLIVRSPVDNITLNTMYKKDLFYIYQFNNSSEFTLKGAVYNSTQKLPYVEAYPNSTNTIEIIFLNQSRVQGIVLMDNNYESILIFYIPNNYQNSTLNYII